MNNQHTTDSAISFDDELLAFADTAATATRTALNEIDGELEAVSNALTSLRSREMLLCAARDEVLQRARAAEAIEKCLEFVRQATGEEMENGDVLCSPLYDSIQEQLDEQLAGILSVAERVAA